MTPDNQINFPLKKKKNKLTGEKKFQRPKEAPTCQRVAGAAGGAQPPRGFTPASPSPALGMRSLRRAPRASASRQLSPERKEKKYNNNE